MSAKSSVVSNSDADSDSESEDSSQCHLSQEKHKRQRKHTDYQCPADFVACDLSSCSSTLSDCLNDGNKELWLIKAPINFNPQSLFGRTVPTMGLETIKVHTGNQQVYSVLGRPVAAGNARLLTTAGRRSGGTLLAPAFSGIINVCESYGGCQGDPAAPTAIPACPAPQVPPGLKQRFQPFGSRTASARKPRVGEEPDGPADAPTPTKRARTDPEEAEAPKKKKKKKKDKTIVEMKEEMVEEEISAAVSGLTETSQEPAPGDGGVAEKKRKKKKKSKDRDRAEMEEGGSRTEMGLSIKQEVEVKPEMFALACSDFDSLPKKKKVKKEKKHSQC